MTAHFFDVGFETTKHPAETKPRMRPASAPDEPKAGETQTQKITATLSQFSGFASILRLFGALIMIAAMSAFLIQGWQEGDDISRYYMLLSQTGLLAAGGFALSFLFKENKGARVFFGLGLISIIVNMTTLGALIFSTMQWGGTLVEYPDFARWQAVGIDTIFLALMATLACCAPLAYFSHKVLARQSANLFSALFLGMNMLLLLPVRESLLAGGVALAATLLPLLFIRRQLAQDISLRTAEGLFAIATLLLPGAIIMFRSLWLYPADDLLILMLSATAYLSLRMIAQQMDKQLVAHRLTGWLSIGAAFGVSQALSSIMEPILAPELAVAFFTFPLTLLLLDIAERSSKPVSIINIAMIMLAICHIISALVGIGTFSGLVCMLAGAAIILIGCHYHISRGIGMGSITILIGGAVQCREIIAAIDFSSWVTLSVTGATIIVAASLLERHGAYLKLKWSQLEKYGE